MSVFASIGRRIGVQAVAEMQADGSLDWAIRSGALDGIERATRGISDPVHREKVLRCIAIERGRLGPHPQRQYDEMSAADIPTVLLLASGLVGAFWFIVWLVS